MGSNTQINFVASLVKLKINFFVIIIMIIALSAALIAANIPTGLEAYAEAGYDFGGPLPTPYDFGGPLPARKPMISVLDLGAVPNDNQDDTDAFQEAIDQGGVISIPEGEFKLSRRLIVRKRGTVLLGAGSEKTTLRFTKSLEQLEPWPTSTTGGLHTTNWSWWGGLLTFEGSSREGKPVEFSSAKRGDVHIKLDRTNMFKAGDGAVISLSAGNNPTRLVKFLYAGDTGNISSLKAPSKVRISVRIAGVTPTGITLTKPLLIDLPAEFTPAIATAGARDDYGIRGVGFRLTQARYRGHFREDGWNPIQFRNVHHGWMEDILCSGVDSGPYISGGSSYVTIRNIVLEAGRRADSSGAVGHHGISLGGRAHRLEDFDFKTRFIHDISFSPWSNGNVVRNGRANGLSLDFHKQGPFANLVTNVKTDVGKFVFNSSGGTNLGHHAGGWNIFWNIVANGTITGPHSNFGPTKNTFVGIDWTPRAPLRFKASPLRDGDSRDLWLSLSGGLVTRTNDPVFVLKLVEE